MDLYHATNDRYPKDLDEFMNEIIKANNIALPKLPPYQAYGYDEKEHKLVILEYQALKDQPLRDSFCRTHSSGSRSIRFRVDRRTAGPLSPIAGSAPKIEPRPGHTDLPETATARPLGGEEPGTANIPYGSLIGRDPAYFPDARRRSPENPTTNPLSPAPFNGVNAVFKLPRATTRNSALPLPRLTANISLQTCDPDEIEMRIAQIRPDQAARLLLRKREVASCVLNVRRHVSKYAIDVGLQHRAPEVVDDLLNPFIVSYPEPFDDHDYKANPSDAARVNQILTLLRDPNCNQESRNQNQQCSDRERRIL